MCCAASNGASQAMYDYLRSRPGGVIVCKTANVAIATPEIDKAAKLFGDLVVGEAIPHIQGHGGFKYTPGVVKAKGKLEKVWAEAGPRKLDYKNTMSSLSRSLCNDFPIHAGLHVRPYKHCKESKDYAHPQMLRLRAYAQDFVGCDPAMTHLVFNELTLHEYEWRRVIKGFCEANGIAFTPNMKIENVEAEAWRERKKKEEEEKAEKARLAIAELNAQTAVKAAYARVGQKASNRQQKQYQPTGGFLGSILGG